jgi:Leucine-rich repeat (LRR) protein
LEQLPEAIGELPSLVKLDISNNSIRFLPTSMGHFKKIQRGCLSLQVGKEWCICEPLGALCDPTCMQELTREHAFVHVQALTALTTSWPRCPPPWAT